MTQQTDWWDRLYDGTDPLTPTARPTLRKVTDDPDQEPDGGDDVQEHDDDGGRSWWRRPAGLPARRRHTDDRDHDAESGVRRRGRALAYNCSAAIAGHGFGLVQLVNGWITSCGDEYSIGAALILGAGICAAAALLIDRRSRGWWPPLAWACRIPLASAVVALGLYAPASL